MLFLKLLSFFQVSIYSLSKSRKAIPYSNLWIEVGISTDIDFCFLQWYVILGSISIPINEVDEALNCIRLCLQKSSGKVRILSTSREYVRVSLDSIWGAVHIMRSDAFILSINKVMSKEISSKPFLVTCSLGVNAVSLQLVQQL